MTPRGAQACLRGLLAASVLLLSGCIRRALTIQTEPPGARVYVNEEYKGTSPVTYDFMWYGWHRVRLEKDGYTQVEDRQLLRAPIYLWIPIDVVLELAPVPIRDQRTWRYVLTPPEELPTPRPPAASHEPVEGTNAAR